MRRFVDVAGAVWWRSVHNFISNPAFIAPSIIFPLFFFTAFAGGLSSVGDVPGFDYPAGYTAFAGQCLDSDPEYWGGVRAAPMAASPATPAPITKTLAGGTRPAAVIWPVKKRP